MKKFKSILIIDDNEDDVYIAKRVVKRGGFAEEVYSVGDGESALALFSNFEESEDKYGDAFPPQIVFLDINMPRVGGFEVLEGYEKLINEQSKTMGSSFFIMFSSSSREEDKERALKYSFVKDYMVKPPTTEQLERVFSDIAPIEV